MVNYKHTQIGYYIWIAIILVTILFGIILAQTGFILPVVILIIFILLILLSFSYLTVSIDKNYLKIRFGWGIFYKKFSLNEIKSVKVAKNHWYYGWGIRIWLWPRMIIFNVSGFNAVEIIMKNGRIYRIGTNEPHKLAHILINSIK